MKTRRFLVVTGPTASGKTAVSISLAKALGVPVISADSMQIYRGCEIGTAKATKDEMQNVPHYMLGIITPDEPYSVAKYQQEAFSLIERFNSEGFAPVVAGGTGLYINALVYQLNFGEYSSDDTIRQKYTQLADDKSDKYLYNILKQKDPEYANLIVPQDTRRIIRRLELLDSGNAESYDFRQQNDTDEFIMIGLTMQRDVLYKRIEERVDSMMKNGLEDEARIILQRYYGSNAAKAIGYKEFTAYFEGKASLEQTAALIKRNSRRYAKRQMTWFRRDPRIEWFDVYSYPCIEDLTDGIISYVKRKGF